LDPQNRILPYLSSPVKVGRRPRSRKPIRFGPGAGLVLAIVAVIASTSLHYKKDELAMHGLAIFLMAIACICAAAGCVTGFGDHDNGYLPLRSQIFGGIVGLIDLVMAFTAIILFAAMI
jgi:hypothetical protein